MERIADTIADRVAAQVNIPRLLRGDSKSPYDADAAIAHLKLAGNVLTNWEKVCSPFLSCLPSPVCFVSSPCTSPWQKYESTRKKMGDDRQQVRWDFLPQRLFGRTNYMAKRIADMVSIVEDVESFRKILGPKLKAVTGEAVAIDRVIRRVDRLVDPLCDIAFNVFSPNTYVMWTEVFDQFKQNVEEIQCCVPRRPPDPLQLTCRRGPTPLTCVCLPLDSHHNEVH